jgi:hypothetical protein
VESRFRTSTVFGLAENFTVSTVLRPASRAYSDGLCMSPSGLALLKIKIATILAQQDQLRRDLSREGGPQHGTDIARSIDRSRVVAVPKFPRTGDASTAQLALTDECQQRRQRWRK